MMKITELIDDFELEQENTMSSARMIIPKDVLRRIDFSSIRNVISGPSSVFTFAPQRDHMIIFEERPLGSRLMVVLTPGEVGLFSDLISNMDHANEMEASKEIVGDFIRSFFASQDRDSSDTAGAE